MLNKTQRLSTNRVSWLLKKGFKFNNDCVSVKFHLNPGPSSRFSIVVSKKVRPLATDRNLLRRQLYEIIRNAPAVLPPTDYIILIKPRLADLPLPKKQEALLDSLAQISSKLN